jgi:hypothetical protein
MKSWRPTEGWSVMARRSTTDHRNLRVSGPVQPRSDAIRRCGCAVPDTEGSTDDPNPIVPGFHPDPSVILVGDQNRGRHQHLPMV